MPYTSSVNYNKRDIKLLKQILDDNNFEKFKGIINTKFRYNNNMLLLLKKNIQSNKALKICLTYMHSEQSTILYKIHPIYIKKNKYADDSLYIDDDKLYINDGYVCVIEYCLYLGSEYLKYIIYLIENGYYNISFEIINEIFDKPDVYENNINEYIKLINMLIKNKIIDINYKFENGDNILYKIIYIISGNPGLYDKFEELLKYLIKKKIDTTYKNIINDVSILDNCISNIYNEESMYSFNCMLSKKKYNCNRKEKIDDIKNIIIFIKSLNININETDNINNITILESIAHLLNDENLESYHGFTKILLNVLIQHGATF